MRKYMVNGQVTVSCWTEVEAESREEAFKIAHDRDTASLAANSLYPDADEAWHFENDGMPEKLKIEIEL